MAICGLLRAAVAACLMRVVGRRVEAGQPRRRFMGGSGCWEREDMVVWYRWCHAGAMQR